MNQNSNIRISKSVALLVLFGQKKEENELPQIGRNTSDKNWRKYLSEKRQEKRGRLA